MKIAKQVPVYLLAAVFIIFGVMYFLKMMPEPKLEGNPLEFMKLMGGTGYIDVVKVLEVLGGLLLLFPRTKGMGLCITTPICVNILLYELCIAKEPGIGIALVLLSALAIYFNKERFKGIL
jgi:putative oxidoreductase